MEAQRTVQKFNKKPSIIAMIGTIYGEVLKNIRKRLGKRDTILHGTDCCIMNKKHRVKDGDSATKSTLNKGPV